MLEVGLEGMASHSLPHNLRYIRMLGYGGHGVVALFQHLNAQNLPVLFAHFASSGWK